MTSLTSGQAFHLVGIDTAADLRAALTDTADAHCVNGVLDACMRPLVYSRHHWLTYKGEYRVRADLRSALEAVRPRPPHEWDNDEADLVLTLLALDSSSVGLDELRDRADSAAVRDVLHDRHTLYSGVVTEAQEVPATLLEFAQCVERMRAVVLESHEPYSIIDGRAWYRTEGLIPRTEINADRLTDDLADVLVTGFGTSPAASPDKQLRIAARTAIAEHGDSAPLVRAVMRAALADPVLRADHVTVTCPMGDMLDRPHEMTTSGAFFTETQLRDGLDLGEYTERLGHESTDQLQRTIRARMLKLKRGAIRSLYGPGCLQGQFVEKHGGHMIFRNEDAHYRGHQSIGCSSGGRASFVLRYDRDGVEQALTSMVGDFRVVRMSHDECDTFTARELRQAIRYGEWIRAVVEETYRTGAVVRAQDPSADR